MTNKSACLEGGLFWKLSHNSIPDICYILTWWCRWQRNPQLGTTWFANGGYPCFDIIPLPLCLSFVVPGQILQVPGIHTTVGSFPLVFLEHNPKWIIHNCNPNIFDPWRTYCLVVDWPLAMWMSDCLTNRPHWKVAKLLDIDCSYMLSPCSRLKQNFG